MSLSPKLMQFKCRSTLCLTMAFFLLQCPSCSVLSPTQCSILSPLPLPPMKLLIYIHLSRKNHFPLDLFLFPKHDPAIYRLISLLFWSILQLIKLYLIIHYYFWGGFNIIKHFFATFIYQKFFKKEQIKCMNLACDQIVEKEGCYSPRAKQFG